MQSHQGSCHCGRVRYRVEADLGAATILDCNCSICRKKGLLHLIVPPDRFELLAGGEHLTTYRWGTRVARHLFCSHCGVVPFYRPRSHPDFYDVNVRSLDDVSLAELTIESFDGVRWEESIDEIR